MDLDFLLRPAVQNYIIAKLATANPADLLLKKHDFSAEQMSWIVSQITARQKLKPKMPAWYAMPQLLFMPLSAEQCSSFLTASYKATLLPAKLHIADLTGGLGIDTQAFSQKAKQVWHIERDATLHQIAKHNLTYLGAKNIHFYHTTAEAFIAQCPAEVEAFYVDPARRDSEKNAVWDLAEGKPNILKLLPLLFDKAPLVLLKASPMIDISRTTQQLGNVSKVSVLAIKNEVKELVFSLNRSIKAGSDYTIEALNWDKNNILEIFSFSASAESMPTQVALAMPQNYIFEPNNAILKAGAFKSFAQQLGLAKLHPSTHLYTTNTLPPIPIQGRGFILKSICKYDAKALKKLLPDMQANLTTRHFPESVAQIRRRLKLKEGGSTYIFATTLLQGQHALLVCEKIP